MGTYLPPPVQKGQSEVCPTCLKDHDVEVTIHAEEVTYNGVTSLKWRNTNGSSHITKVGDEFVHVRPATNNLNGSGNGKVNPLRADIVEHKTFLCQSNGWKIYAARYHAVRELFEETVTDLPANVQGMVVGNMLTNYFSHQDANKGNVSLPTDTRGSLPAKVQSDTSMDIPKNLAVKGRVNVDSTIEDNVKNIIFNNPTFFSTKQSNNAKIKLYYEQVLGIDITVIQRHAVESVTRAFRKQLSEQHKHRDEEQAFRRKYGKTN